MLNNVFNAKFHLIFLSTFCREQELKIGALVGEDKYGNKYFENDRFFLGKNFWYLWTFICRSQYGQCG